MVFEYIKHRIKFEVYFESNRTYTYYWNTYYSISKAVKVYVMDFVTKSNSPYKRFLGINSFLLYERWSILKYILM